MPSLFSYRFDQMMQNQPPAEQPRCRLLSVHLFVNDLALEETFYSNLLGAAPSRDQNQSLVYPLAEGINLVLAQSQKPGEADSSAANRVELELETHQLYSLWRQIYASALGQVSELKEKMFKALSPSGILLHMRQWNTQD